MHTSIRDTPSSVPQYLCRFPGVNGDVGRGDGANHGDVQDELQGKSVHETNGETTRKETDARYRTEYHRKREPQALQRIISTNGSRSSGMPSFWKRKEGEGADDAVCLPCCGPIALIPLTWLRTLHFISSLSERRDVATVPLSRSTAFVDALAGRE